MTGAPSGERRSLPIVRAGFALPADLPATAPGEAMVFDVGRQGAAIGIERRTDQAWRSGKAHVGQLHQFGYSDLAMLREGCRSGACDLLLFTDRHGIAGTVFGAGIALITELEGKRYVLAMLHLRRSVRDLTAFGEVLALSGRYIAAAGACIATPRRVRLDGYRAQLDRETDAYGYERSLEILQ